MPLRYVTIYLPSFMNIGLGVKKLVWVDSQTHRQNLNRISLLLCSQNKVCRLMMRRSIEVSKRTISMERSP
jgi:hypothetical protein